MAKNTDEKINILEAVKAFAKDDISKAGINLLAMSVKSVARLT